MELFIIRCIQFMTLNGKNNIFSVICVTRIVEILILHIGTIANLQTNQNSMSRNNNVAPQYFIATELCTIKRTLVCSSCMRLRFTSRKSYCTLHVILYGNLWLNN